MDKAAPKIIFLEKVADGLQHWQPRPRGDAEQARWDAWASELFADCTDKERKVMMETLLALKASMRGSKIGDADHTV